MDDKELTSKETLKAEGVYIEADTNEVAQWKLYTPEQREQYIAMAVDLILAHPEYAALPPESRLSRDQLIEELQANGKLMLQIDAE